MADRRNGPLESYLLSSTASSKPSINGPPESYLLSNAVSSKPFVVVLVCILSVIMLSILSMAIKRWQDEKKEEQRRQTALSIHATAVAVDPMSEIFFGYSTSSVDTEIRPPPPVYTAKDQHLEFSNCPPPPPFSTCVSIPTPPTQPVVS